MASARARAWPTGQGVQTPASHSGSRLAGRRDIAWIQEVEKLCRASRLSLGSRRRASLEATRRREPDASGVSCDSNRDLDAAIGRGRESAGERAGIGSSPSSRLGEASGASDGDATRGRGWEASSRDAGRGSNESPGPPRFEGHRLPSVGPRAVGSEPPLSASGEVHGAVRSFIGASTGKRRLAGQTAGDPLPLPSSLPEHSLVAWTASRSPVLARGTGHPPAGAAGFLSSHAIATSSSPRGARPWTRAPSRRSVPGPLDRVLEPPMLAPEKRFRSETLGSEQGAGSKVDTSNVAYVDGAEGPTSGETTRGHACARVAGALGSDLEATPPPRETSSCRLGLMDASEDIAALDADAKRRRSVSVSPPPGHLAPGAAFSSATCPFCSEDLAGVPLFYSLEHVRRCRVRGVARAQKKEKQAWSLEAARGRGKIAGQRRIWEGKKNGVVGSRAKGRRVGCYPAFELETEAGGGPDRHAVSGSMQARNEDPGAQCGVTFASKKELVVCRGRSLALRPHRDLSVPRSLLDPFVAAFLQTLGLSRLAPLFVAQEIDRRALATLSDGDLRGVGVGARADRAKLLDALGADRWMAFVTRCSGTASRSDDEKDEGGAPGGVGSFDESAEEALQSATLEEEALETTNSFISSAETPNHLITNTGMSNNLVRNSELSCSADDGLFVCVDVCPLPPLPRRISASLIDEAFDAATAPKSRTCTSEHFVRVVATKARRATGGALWAAAATGKVTWPTAEAWAQRAAEVSAAAVGGGRSIADAGDCRAYLDLKIEASSTPIASSPAAHPTDAIVDLTGADGSPTSAPGHSLELRSGLAVPEVSAPRDVDSSASRLASSSPAAVASPLGTFDFQQRPQLVDDTSPLPLALPSRSRSSGPAPLLSAPSAPLSSFASVAPDFAVSSLSPGLPRWLSSSPCSSLMSPAPALLVPRLPGDFASTRVALSADPQVEGQQCDAGFQSELTTQLEAFRYLQESVRESEREFWRAGSMV